MHILFLFYEVWPPSNLEDIAMTKEHVIKIKDKNSPWFVHEYGKEVRYIGA